MLQVPDFDTCDLSAVKGIIAGGGPSTAALVREARERFGAPYSIRYSSTESGGLGTLTAWDAPDAEALYTVGRPRPGTELQIRSIEDAGEVGVGETGEVCLRSPAVMEGYWRAPEETAAALDPDGWLRTGDLGTIGEDGCLRITGRLREMYIRGGYNVFPQEVEAVLADHPAVQAVCVVAAPDPVMGEIGVAVVVARRGATAPTLEALRSFAGERLAAYKLPEAIQVLDALPVTSMDKVDRQALEAQVARTAT
jgi:acyl-CoA synthetase (AMP-forming)/AMP-acid ligase II